MVEASWLFEHLATPIFIAALTVALIKLLDFWAPTRTEKQSKRYAAAVLAARFEKFAIMCAEQISQHELSNSSSGCAGRKFGSVPSFPELESEVDDSKIEPAILSDAYSFINQMHLSDSQIAFWWDVLGEQDLVQNECFNQAGLLGHKAIEIANRLRMSADLAKPDYELDYWNFPEKLAEVAKTAREASGK